MQLLLCSERHYLVDTMCVIKTECGYYIEDLCMYKKFELEQ